MQDYENIKINTKTGIEDRFEFGHGKDFWNDLHKVNVIETDENKLTIMTNIISWSINDDKTFKYYNIDSILKNEAEYYTDGEYEFGYKVKKDTFAKISNMIYGYEISNLPEELKVAGQMARGGFYGGMEVYDIYTNGTNYIALVTTSSGIFYLEFNLSNFLEDYNMYFSNITEVYYKYNN